DRSCFVPFASAKCRVLRLEAPGNERGESARLFLQVIDALKVISAVLESLSHAEHHRGSGTHAKLVRGTMHGDPVFSEAFQSRDAMPDFVIEDLRTATGNGVEAGVSQSHDGVAQGKLAVFRNRQDL